MCSSGFLILPECEQIGVGVIVEVAGFDSDVGERLSGFAVSGQSQSDRSVARRERGVELFPADDKLDPRRLDCDWIG